MPRQERCSKGIFFGTKTQKSSMGTHRGHSAVGRGVAEGTSWGSWEKISGGPSWIGTLSIWKHDSNLEGPEKPATCPDSC